MKKNILKRHAEMVDDPHRTPLVTKAILKTVRPGDSIFDLGCGTGVLTLAALQAGADSVAACDVDETAIQAAQVLVRKAGMADKVRFYPGLSSDVVLPEKVDLILAETVGSFGLDENILPFVIDARKRLLKKGGTIIPARLTVFVAPLRDSAKSPLTPLFQRGEGGKKGKKSSPPFEKGGLGGIFHAGLITPDQLLAPPQKFTEVTLLTVKHLGIDHEIKFQITQNGELTGFAGWVEIEWAPGIATSTSPFSPPTHWKQGLLLNEKIEKVKKGDSLLFRLRIGPKVEIFATESELEWGYKIN